MTLLNDNFVSKACASIAFPMPKVLLSRVKQQPTRSKHADAGAANCKASKRKRSVHTYDTSANSSDTIEAGFPKNCKKTCRRAQPSTQQHQQEVPLPLINSMASTGYTCIMEDSDNEESPHDTYNADTQPATDATFCTGVQGEVYFEQPRPIPACYPPGYWAPITSPFVPLAAFPAFRAPQLPRSCHCPYRP